MQRIPPIRLKLASGLVREFSALARLAYPCETYALLIGCETRRCVEVSELYIPDDVADYASKRYVYTPDHWYIEAQEHAREVGCDLIGDIHSHPGYVSCERSEGDHDGTPHWRHIAGIVAVWETARGLRTSTRFWGPTVPIRIL